MPAALDDNVVAARNRVAETFFKPLTNKQRKFVYALFANGFDVGKAAEEADPDLEGQTARRVGGKWYKMPQVAAAIEAMHDWYKEESKVRLDDLIGELKAIAFTPITDYFDLPEKGGKITTLDLPPDGDPRLRAISEISINEGKYGTSYRLKMHNKEAAIDRLTRIFFPQLAGKVAAPGTTGEDDAADKNKTQVNVQAIIVQPVPTGHFIPAPSAQPVTIEVKASPLMIEGDTASATR